VSHLIKIAYYIAAFKEPERIVRLINRVQTNSDFVYVHFDTMIGLEKFREWKSIIEKKCQNKNIKIVSEFRCKWGSFGTVDAALSAMNYFENFDYDYFIHLTGECYPLKSPEHIKRELDGKNCAFIEFFKLPYNGWLPDGGLNRINNRHYFIPKKSYPYVWAVRIPRLKKGLPYGLKPYGGHGGVFLHKKHVNYIVNYVKENPQLRKFFKRAWAPDEMFFETILLNSALKSEVINESKKYADFAENKSHPVNLTKTDFENLKRSGKLFARKFKTGVDNEILNFIDIEIEKSRQNTPVIE
jgi:hypothetical protein